MIPKIIHNIWIQGYNNLPEKIIVAHNNIKKLNPEWEFIVWDESMIIEILKKYPKIYNVYKNIQNLSGAININAIKSDIARYIIMKEYGGLYFDIDFECVSSFDNLFDKNNTIYIASSKIDILNYIYPFSKPEYCSCFMAFEKEHPIWDKVIDIILKATTKYQIGSALDISLQNSKNYEIIVLNQINGPYKCKDSNTICFTPGESSWNFIRPYLQIINCYHIQIILFILVFVIIFVIDRINYHNALSFGSIPIIPGLPKVQLHLNLQDNKKKQKNKK